MTASITGFLTLLLLAFVMIPPLRLTLLERVVRGLPRAFRLHHVLGVAVPAIGAVHALIAMYPYLVASEGLGQALGLFVDPSDTMVLTGTLSWLFLTVTVVMSFRPQMRRTPWLWLHRLSVIGFVLGVAHTFLGRLDILALPTDWSGAASVTVTLLATVVAAGLVLHFARPEWLANHRAFVVTEVAHLQESVVELTLNLGKGRGEWRSGEFGYFRFDCHGPCGVTRERHPFTVVAMSDTGAMKIVVKALGDDTTKLQQILVGTTGEVAGPYGTLEALLSHRAPQLWIAGGLGMMPFVGMARRLGSRGASADDVVLVYLHRPGQQPLFLSEMAELGASRPSLKVVSIESRPDAEVGFDEVATAVPDWRSREVALAGPHAMIEYWNATLRAHGFPQSKIYTEDFTR
jgi:predicted ferric reductase